MNCPCHEMIVAQKEKLAFALTEHKWYESEKAGRDVGCKESQLNFIENIMPDWGQDFRDEFCNSCEKQKKKIP